MLISFIDLLYDLILDAIISVIFGIFVGWWLRGKWYRRRHPDRSENEPI
jgi:hypothetical protein